MKNSSIVEAQETEVANPHLSLIFSFWYQVTIFWGWQTLLFNTPLIIKPYSWSENIFKCAELYLIMYSVQYEIWRSYLQGNDFNDKIHFHVETNSYLARQLIPAQSSFPNASHFPLFICK